MSCEDDEKVISGGIKEVSSDRLIRFGGQNPSPTDPAAGSQAFQDRVRELTDAIMQTYFASLPSNYVSDTTGPLYSIQFQAAAEMLARFQLAAVEVYEDRDFDFTRPDFLFQTLGVLVFPDDSKGIPDIDGDITYREFLQKMILLLLQGSTPDTVREGAGLLTEASVTLLEKIENDYGEDVSRALDEQFGFELNFESYERTTPWGSPGHYHTVTVDCDGNGTTSSLVCFDGETCDDHVHEIIAWEVQPSGDPEHIHTLIPKFPTLPFTLQRNVQLIVKALKPAHTLYEHRNLFRELFGRYVERVLTDGEGFESLASFVPGVFSDEVEIGLRLYEYEDLRKFCLGTREISSVEGETLTDRTLFMDSTRAFKSVRPGALLEIEGGDNEGQYAVREVLSLPIPNDSAQSYVTSSGLTGTATVTNGVIEDTGQDFSTMQVGETFTFSTGPNAGTYLVDRILGVNGGYLGQASGPSTQIRVCPSILRVDRRMPVSASGQSYTVSVDRLGVNGPKQVTGEDVSQFFYI